MRVSKYIHVCTVVIPEFNLLKFISWWPGWILWFEVTEYTCMSYIFKIVLICLNATTKSWKWCWTTIDVCKKMKSFILLFLNNKIAIEKLTTALAVAKWWLGAWDTNKSQLQDGDCFHGWQILAIQPQTPCGREKCICPTDKTFRKRERERCKRDSAQKLSDKICVNSNTYYILHKLLVHMFTSNNQFFFLVMFHMLKAR